MKRKSQLLILFFLMADAAITAIGKLKKTYVIYLSSLFEFKDNMVLQKIEIMK